MIKIGKSTAIIIAIIAITICIFAGCGDDNPVTFSNPTGPAGPSGATGATGPSGDQGIPGPVNAANLTVTVLPANSQSTVTLNRVLENSQVEEINASDSASGGVFVFNNLFPGTYVIVCNAPGYSTHTETIDLPENGNVSVPINLDEVQVGLIKVEPRVCVNPGTVDYDLTAIPFTIKGTDFTGTVAVTLTPIAGGTPITATNVVIVDTQTITCTFDLTGAANGEYTLTVTHTPLTTSATTVSTSFFLVPNIQDAVDKAGDLFVAENLVVQQFGDQPADQVMAYVPPGEYRVGDPGLETILSDEYGIIHMKSGVYLKGAGGGGEGTTPTGTYTMIDGEDNNYLLISMYEYNRNMTIDGFRLTGGDADGDYGGAIDVEYGGDTIAIINNTIIDNHADYDGGAIYIYYVGEEHAWSDVIIKNNVIRDNYSGDGYDGGGIYIDGDSDYADGTVTIDHNIIRDNFAPGSGGDGGGIYLYDLYYGTLANVTDNTITGNGAGDYGGGISVDSMDEGINCNITGNTITGNFAEYGAGIYTDNGYSSSNMIIRDNIINDNGDDITNVNLGGPLYNFGPADYGGGIYSYYYTTIENNTIDGNHADSYGGGIYSEYGDDRIIGNTITDNDSEYGGACYLEYGPQADITGNTITGNNAVYDGGALYISTWVLYSGDDNPFGIHNNIFQDNTIDTPLTYDGADIYNNDPAPPVIDATNNTWDVAPGSLTDDDVFDVGAGGNVDVL